jgi:hypothetical protein
VTTSTHNLEPHHQTTTRGTKHPTWMITPTDTRRESQSLQVHCSPVTSVPKLSNTKLTFKPTCRHTTLNHPGPINATSVPTLHIRSVGSSPTYVSMSQHSTPMSVPTVNTPSHTPTICMNIYTPMPQSKSSDINALTALTQQIEKGISRLISSSGMSPSKIL